MMHLCMPLLQGKVYPTRYINENGGLIRITPYTPLFSASGIYDEYSSLFFGIDPDFMRVVVGGGAVRYNNGGWYRGWDVGSKTHYFWFDKQKGRLYGKSMDNIEGAGFYGKYAYCQLLSKDGIPLYSVYDPKIMDGQYMAKNYPISELTTTSNWSLVTYPPLGNPIYEWHPMSIYGKAEMKNGVPADDVFWGHIKTIREAFKGRKFLFVICITPAQDSRIYGEFDNKPQVYDIPKVYYTPSGVRVNRFIGVHVHAWHHDIGGYGYFVMYVFERSAFEEGGNLVDLQP